MPWGHSSYADVAITSGAEEAKGFYAAAQTLVPDLRYVSSIVIGNKLKDEWKCVAWKTAHQRGLRFPPLAELRTLFEEKHGKQAWPEEPGEPVEWATSASSNYSSTF